ncbi:conserved hypothetical protein [Capnocytophaga canimorsus]|uniref:Uncharacterized protein n=1 Tax=Capnocytophaga canimorsus TaxID=28188 RepID=A0A0B7I813_9FLAO|nr:conserved hypothetical protein [Capnocytophaga canimorsus]
MLFASTFVSIYFPKLLVNTCQKYTFYYENLNLKIEILSFTHKITFKVNLYKTPIAFALF